MTLRRARESLQWKALVASHLHIIRVDGTGGFELQHSHIIEVEGTGGFELQHLHILHNVRALTVGDYEMSSLRVN